MRKKYKLATRQCDTAITVYTKTPLISNKLPVLCWVVKKTEVEEIHHGSHFQLGSKDRLQSDDKDKDCYLLKLINLKQHLTRLYEVTHRSGPARLHSSSYWINF